jgi:hypothetical protein
MLRYLAVAHFGRGRGNFVEGEAPAFWQAEVERALAMHADALGEAWRTVRANPKEIAQFQAVVTDIGVRVLEQLYPSSPIFAAR